MPHLSDEQTDALREVVNVAMGRAADSLAQLLDCFIRLPVPRVGDVPPSLAEELFCGEALCSATSSVTFAAANATARGLICCLAPDSAQPRFDDLPFAAVADNISEIFARNLGEMLVVQADYTAARESDQLKSAGQFLPRQFTGIEVAVPFRLEDDSVQVLLLLLLPSSQLPAFSQQLQGLLDD